uniref:hypothetical protein n=1 Tax=Agathobacter sp. TaxID=2021311 RepID=UPI00405661A2
MDISKLKTTYENRLKPIFREQFRIDDSEESSNWMTILLDGEQEEFSFSLYGNDCVHLYWCNECFIFDKSVYGEIIIEISHIEKEGREN